MSRYLLDTDIAIEVFRGRDMRVIAALASHPRADVAISVVTVAEMAFGAGRSANPSVNPELASRFWSSFEVLPLSKLASEISGGLRATLETLGQRIGPYDVLIAGIALAEDRMLVTHNSREFDRVPDLKTEDWRQIRTASD